MFLLGIAVIVAGFMMLIVFIGGRIIDYVDIPSAVAIVFPLIAVLMATNGFKVFAAGFMAAAFPKTEIAEKMRGQAASLFRLLSKTAVLAAALASTISLVNIFSHIPFRPDTPIAFIGMSIWAICAAWIFALFLILAVFEPVVFNLKKRSGFGRR